MVGRVDKECRVFGVRLVVAFENRVAAETVSNQMGFALYPFGVKVVIGHSLAEPLKPGVWYVLHGFVENSKKWPVVGEDSEVGAAQEVMFAF